MVECKEGIIEDPVRGERYLLVHHFFGFIENMANSSFIWGTALPRDVTNFVTVETLVWWLVRLLVWFDLGCISLGYSVAPVRGAGPVACVHQDQLVVHPLWGVRRHYLPWREVSLGLLISMWHLHGVAAEAPKVRCILCY